VLAMLNAAELRRCLLPRSGGQGATAVSVISAAETAKPEVTATRKVRNEPDAVAVDPA
jgi:hypothetical protein